MELKYFLTIFTTVFIAELGDKTQLATLIYAADNEHNKWLVFTAAILALALSTLLGVLLGGSLGTLLNEQWLRRMAGIGFVIIGLWTLYTA